MTGTVVALGEMIARLKPPGKLRLRQANQFEISYGGAEANVANSLAQFGLPVRFISALPDTEMGEQAIMSMRACRVDTSHVSRRPGRMGLYFMEEGADVRAGCVIYDRQDTAFAALTPDDVDWDRAMDGASWFHISGISPAIAQSTADLSIAAVKVAKARGLTVSVDLNYRERLWKYGVSPKEIMTDIVSHADVLIAGRGDCAACLGFAPDGDGSSNDWYEELSAEAMARFPNLTIASITIRNSQSADRHSWAAHLQSSHGSFFSRTYDLNNVVDRVGTGDAFSAGLIYGLHTQMEHDEALEFGAASNALKHTIPGDPNAITVKEIHALIDSDGMGRLRR